MISGSLDLFEDGPSLRIDGMPIAERQPCWLTSRAHQAENTHLAELRIPPDNSVTPPTLGISGRSRLPDRKQPLQEGRIALGELREDGVEVCAGLIGRLRVALIERV